MKKHPLDEAVKAAGSLAKLGKMIGVKNRCAIWQWKQPGRRIPAQFVIPIEKATGVSRHKLRSDLYPQEGVV